MWVNVGKLSGIWLRACTTSALLLIVCRAVPAATWVRYTSPNFELYTDTREATARDVLGRLELIRHVFLDTAGPAGAPLPVRVFVFASPRDFRPFRPTEVTRGFYQSGPERDYIAMHDADEETMRVVFHEYVHLVLNHSVPAVPRWLEEGTAEFYSTLQARDERLLIGMPVPSLLRVLGSQPWLSAAALASVTRDSPEYNDARKSGLFYAQSWALVHMLNLAPGYRKSMPRFSQLVYQGVPVTLAFEQAFSKRMEDALNDLRAYLRGGTLPVTASMWKPPSAAEIAVDTVAPEQVEVAQIELLLRIGSHDAAAPRLKKLEREHPRDAFVLTELAMFAMGARRVDEARRYFEQAIAARSTHATTYFEYAMLLRDSGAPRDRVRELLREAVGRNPKHAEAHFLLGLMASQDGDHAAAAAAIEHAVAVLPRQSYFWHALATAYRQLGRDEEARRAARRAAESARTSHEMEMAQSALRLTTAAAAANVAAPRPTVNTPKSWEMPKGDARVDGTLEHIDCLGQNARFHIRAEGKSIALFVDNPGRILLNTPSSLTFEFTCGTQKARRVLVEYRRNPRAERRTEGDITAIEFP